MFSPEGTFGVDNSAIWRVDEIEQRSEAIREKGGHVALVARSRDYVKVGHFVAYVHKQADLFKSYQAPAWLAQHSDRYPCLYAHTTVEAMDTNAFDVQKFPDVDEIVRQIDEYCRCRGCLSTLERFMKKHPGQHCVRRLAGDRVYV